MNWQPVERLRLAAWYQSTVSRFCSETSEGVSPGTGGAEVEVAADRSAHQSRDLMSQRLAVGMFLGLEEPKITVELEEVVLHPD